eukprot:m.19164 g.19164  ORF g.19164 m.19164 type:complete len:188 (-) comp30715_c0_seq1:27-590(-)
MGAFSLKDQLNFYGQYHANAVNKAIHIVCVPILLWTAVVWFTYTGPLLPAPSFLNVELNFGFLASIGYGLYYMSIEPLAGSIAFFFLFNGARVATAWVAHDHDAWKIALGIHILSWVLQFIGHGVFEKRAPALFTSLFQSLVLAPLFVLLEVMFMAGYKPELARELHETATQNIAAFRKQQQEKKAN